MAPAQADATGRILELLKGAGVPESKAPTSLEYRGQWQPKPNGAETGHGVVPKEWALELASENDRTLASFGWAGGAQLCLSNAFRQAEELEAQAQDLIDSGTCTKDDAPVQCIRAIAKATEEREALMRRQWCDIDFQQGEEANQELLKHLERDFASQLARTAARQEEVEETWYNIRLREAEAGKVYLGASVGGDSVELTGYDDESGRQRWQLLPEGRQGTGSASWHLLRLLGGTGKGRRLLSRGLRGLELCELDDSSGRQRWQVDCSSESCVLRAATGSGDPGLGAAAAVEAKAAGCCLGEAGGGVVLQALEMRWDIRGPAGRFGAGQSAGQSKASEESGDDILALVQKVPGVAKGLSEDRIARVLGHNRNLGTAIDLVGAYLKNYEIDKADRLCARLLPLCLERGGVWHFKLLNFYTTVRMKQSRYEEALEMYKEYETLIKFSPEEAWELYDTVYRNFGWIYTSLHDYDQALEYFEKCVSVKRDHGVSPHWFDQWDLGKTHARLSLQRSRPEGLSLAARLIREALDMHRIAEPDDLIMRCKMLNSAGECLMVRGDFCADSGEARRCYDESIELHEESYQLYMQVLGPSKPLTGWAMEDLAGAYQRRQLPEKAKPLLLGALRVECSKDIIKLPSMARLLDSLLELHEATGDRGGLAACQEAINRGLANLQRRGVDQSEGASYTALLQKIAKMLLAHDVQNRPLAAELLREGLQYLSKATPVQRLAPARDEQERIYVPKAGQQDLEVDARVLRRSLEDQLQELTSAQSAPPFFEVVDDDNDDAPGTFTCVD